ncbi:trypsin-like peptidase domain-containing protein [Actinoplanes sp. NPDC051861]|uniref:VMAP-C domain-containing protein n=1 Tax=Actinoplanes sp. NPDC051861 TaxID=3155170 RepID=UPI003447FF9E
MGREQRRMSEPLWQARVDVPATSRWGSGFLVTDRHVLTCAHVVLDATEVLVKLRDTPERRAGTVVTSGPWFSPTAKDADLAVVELDRPVSVAPARLAPHSAVEIYARQELTALGFPERFVRDGVNSSFTAAPDRPIGPNVQLDASDDLGVWLQSGFSGAAAYHMTTRQVVGMVKSAVWDQERLGVMVPVSQLAEHCPQLNEIIRLGSISPRAYTELRAALHPVRDLSREEVGQLLTLVRAGGVKDIPELNTVQALVEALVVETVMVDDRRMRYHLNALLGMLKTDETWRWAHKHLGPDVPAAAPPPRVVDHDCAIVVCLEPAAATGTESYELTVWTVSEPDGELCEPVVNKERVTPAQWQERVEEELVKARRRLPPTSGTVYVEFVLPRRFLAEPVDEWKDFVDGGVPLGVNRPVAVRDLDWFSDAYPSDLIRRAAVLRDQRISIGEVLRSQDCGDPPRSLRSFGGWLRDEDDGPFAVGLSGEWAGSEHVSAAAAACPPILLWRRQPCPPGAHVEDGECSGTRFVEELRKRLHNVTIDGIGSAVRKMRASAVAAEDEAHFGTGLSLLRDDARRRPIPLSFAE